MEQEIEPSREGLELQLLNLYNMRGTINALKPQEEKLAALVKFWLAKHPEDKLYDGEHGITAWLEERSNGRPRPCDLWSLYENDRPLFEQLVRTNCLAINPTALKTAGALVGGIERYLGPQGQTAVLHVRRDE